MSHQPAHHPVIDGFEFASAGAKQQGIWPLRDFPRLRDALASDAGEVAYEISGVRDERGRPSLRLKVNGTLMLRCQRCLETMPLDVDIDQTLVLAATLAEIHAEPADSHAPDRVVAGKEMALRELIEDELILAVPYAPRHEDCEPAGAGDRTEKVSPFAELRSLMRNKH
jgi:uncharacterized protein